MGTETKPFPSSTPDSDVVALRFGPFELDLRSGEMRRAGVLVRLQPQPFKVLALLAARPGELVTREEIQKDVWPAGTFVDFEQSLNFCIRQIRSALGDSAISPRFVETLPRRGYRFNFGPVETVRVPGAVLEWRRPTPLQPAEETEAPAPPAARDRKRTWLVVAGALALGALAVLAFLTLRPRAPQRAPTFSRLTYRRGAVASARFAPDGQMVYSAAFDGQPTSFFLSRIETRDTRPLALAGGFVRGVSRQGEFAFLRGGVLARAPLAGGPAKEILDKVMEADWSADGEFAVVRGGYSQAKIEYPVGTVLGEAIWPSHLRISPDLQRVAYLDHPVLNDDRGHVVVVDRKGHRTKLTEDFASAEGLAWSPRSDEVFFTAAKVGTDSALHSVTLDGRLRTVLPAMGRLVLHDISPTGRLLIERTTMRQEIRFRRLAEKEDRDLSWLDYSMVEGLSPDGSTLVFSETGEGGGPDYSIFLRKTDGSLPVRIGSGRPSGPSPDGKWVLSIPLHDRSRIDVLPTGPGEVRAIRNPGITQYEVAGFVGDGQTIFFTERGIDGKRRTFVQDLAGGPPRSALPDGVWIMRNLFSPDGRFIGRACSKTDEGLCLFPVGGGDPKAIPGFGKKWSPLGFDGAGRLYILHRSEEPATAEIHRVDTVSGRSEAWATIRPPDVAGVVELVGISVARNAEAFAYSYRRRLADLYVVDDAR